MRTILFLWLILSLSSFLAAQEEDTKKDSTPSYTVTVTADRLEEPLNEKSDAISVITRDEIEVHQWHYVLDALRQVPGISITQYGSPGKLTSVFLRGAGSSQVLVLLDGMPLNDPYFGGVRFEDLTTDNVERIEVLKGAQSPLYGSDSVSGVIQIITREGEAGNAVSAAFEGGSFSTYREKAGVHGSSGRADYSVSASRQDSEGRFDNDELAENAFSATGGYTLSENTRLFLAGHVFDSQIGIPFHIPPVEPSPLQSQDSNLGLFGTGVKHVSGQFLNLDARFSFVSRDFSFEDPGGFFGSGQNSSSTYQLTIQNDLYAGDGNTFTAGYEFEHQTIDAEDSVNGPYPLTDMNDHAFFLQNKRETEHWIATGGLRFDHYNTFGITLNPRVSVAFLPNRDLKIRGSFGTAFRAPSAGDLGYPFYGNPDLKPETSRSWELGIDKNWGREFALTASWFRNDYHDLITADPITFIAANVAEAKTQGIEIAGSWFRKGWSLDGGYTFLKTKDETTGLRLVRRPEHTIQLRGAYRNDQWGGSVSLQQISDQLDNDFVIFETVVNPGYYKLDVAGHYQIASWLRLKARIENLTDKEYEEVLYYKAPGRAFYGGFEITLR